MTRLAIPDGVKGLASGLLLVACAAPQPSAAPPAELHITPIASTTGTATTTAATVAEAGDRRAPVPVDDADKVIASLRAPFRNCYQDGLRRDPKMEGRVVVTVVVGESGVVASATLASNTGLAEDVAACITDKLRYARFAALGPGNHAMLQVPVSFVIAKQDGGTSIPSPPRSR